MDIARPDIAVKKRRQRIFWTTGALIALALITVGLSRLKPAVPSVERGLVWIDTVKRGPLVRQVRGTGTLVPEDIRWITARASGLVDKLLLRPGAQVEPDSVILVLFNPDLEQAATQAELQLKVGEAELENLKFQIQSDVLSAEASAFARKAAAEQARLDGESDKRLFEGGHISQNDIRKSESAVANAALQNEAEQKRLAFVRDSVTPRLAAKSAAVEQLRAQARLRREEFNALQVKAGMKGVLQILPVEVGALVGSGTKLARVADPSRLKAEVRVAETQAKDIQLGQRAEVNTRNGIVPARVVRIDPSVQNGTVSVDLELSGDLPRGARPDLSVEGLIELERLEDVVFSQRPPFGQEFSTVGIFKLEPDAIHAQRKPVKLGRSSVNFIEIVEGLAPGDQIILSDNFQSDGIDRIKLK